MVTLVKWAGNQWLRRPGSRRRLLDRWRGPGNGSAASCCNRRGCSFAASAALRPPSWATAGAALPTAEDAEAEAPVWPPIVPEAGPAAEAGEAASACSVAALMRSSCACGARHSNTAAAQNGMGVAARCSDLKAQMQRAVVAQHRTY